MPTPQEARSRQTAHLATEHWWRSRVEALAAQCRADAAFWRERADKCHPFQKVETVFAESRSGAFASCADTLDALIAERNPR